MPCAQAGGPTGFERVPAAYLRPWAASREGKLSICGLFDGCHMDWMWLLHVSWRLLATGDAGLHTPSGPHLQTWGAPFGVRADPIPACVVGLSRMFPDDKSDPRDGTCAACVLESHKTAGGAGPAGGVAGGPLHLISRSQPRTAGGSRRGMPQPRWSAAQSLHPCNDTMRFVWPHSGKQEWPGACHAPA